MNIGGYDQCRQGCQYLTKLVNMTQAFTGQSWTLLGLGHKRVDSKATQ